MILVSHIIFYIQVLWYSLHSNAKYHKRFLLLYISIQKDSNVWPRHTFMLRTTSNYKRILTISSMLTLATINHRFHHRKLISFLNACFINTRNKKTKVRIPDGQYIYMYIYIYIYVYIYIYLDWILVYIKKVTVEDIQIIISHLNMYIIALHIVCYLRKISRSTLKMLITLIRHSTSLLMLGIVPISNENISFSCFSFSIYGCPK